MVSSSKGGGWDAAIVLVGIGSLAAVASMIVGRATVRGWQVDVMAGVAVLASVAALVAVRRSCARTRGIAAQSDVRRRAAVALATLEDEITWELSSDGVIADVSPLVQTVIGLEPQCLIGQSFHAVMPPAERHRGEQLLAAAAASGQGWAGELFHYLDAEGRPVPLISTGIAHVGERGRVLGFSGVLRRPDPNDATVRRCAETRARVDAVLHSGDLRVVFQPILDLADDTVAGCEALARFDAEPSRSPDRWFADAFAVGRGVELELLAVKQALRAAGDLPPSAYLSVNVSPATLISDGLPAVVDASGWDPRRLVLEITEHMHVSDYPPVIEVIRRLRGRGVRIAVDDAGSGYASFHHILAIRPELIKLDRSLIAGIDVDKDRRALIAAVASFAREIGAELVGEGVESSDELRTVRGLGLRYAQGYLIGRPAALPERRALYAANR